MFTWRLIRDGSMSYGTTAPIGSVSMNVPVLDNLPSVWYLSRKTHTSGPNDFE
jgi:hypothetical protein